VKFGTVVVCSKCKQPIASGQVFGYRLASRVPARRVASLSFEDVLREIAPGRNRLLYCGVILRRHTTQCCRC